MPVPDIQIVPRRSKHARLLEHLFIRLTLVAAVGMGLLVIAIALAEFHQLFVVFLSMCCWYKLD